MKRIIAILNEIKQDVDWESESNIIDDELLDSFDMISLVTELDEVFEVTIGLEHLEPENFSSVAAIAALLAELGADVEQ
ncbi:MAG: acyl carrier protein [Oscillospiraceae bacterium]|nr:acyl carrier protein [Oscillospiraceae bacterium]